MGRIFTEPSDQLQPVGILRSTRIESSTPPSRNLSKNESVGDLIYFVLGRKVIHFVSSKRRRKNPQTHTQLIDLSKGVSGGGSGEGGSMAGLRPILILPISKGSPENGPPTEGPITIVFESEASGMFDLWWPLENYSDDTVWRVYDSENNLIVEVEEDFFFQNFSEAEYRRFECTIQDISNVSGDAFFSFNSLSGTIDPNIGYLTGLTTLALDWNNFTGELPETFQNLINLKEFYIDGNVLDGVFPEFISLWTEVEVLFLDNCFDGPIPSSYGNLAHLRDLYFGHRTGPNSATSIPSSFSQLLSLERILCSTRPITGITPGTFNTQPNLRGVNMVDCGLSAEDLTTILEDLVASLNLPNRVVPSFGPQNGINLFNNGSPTSAGITAANVLIGEGWNVNVDGL